MSIDFARIASPTFLLSAAKFVLFTKDAAHSIAYFAKRRVGFNSSYDEGHEILTACGSMFQRS